MDNTIIEQGAFISAGSNVRISLRQDVDWMMVYNLTQANGAQTTAVGVKYYWQRGMPAGAKWVTFASSPANANNLEQYITTNGFTVFDSSVQTPGALNATITAISAAAIPVVTNTGTNGLVAGDVVRLINVTGAQQLGGFDFTVGYNTLSATTFSLDYMSQIVAGTTGSWRRIAFNPIFYPRRRFITNITRASAAVVTTSVTHGYTVGQQVRFVVPAAYGMTQINGLTGNIIATNTSTTVNSFTVDINSSAFTAFAFPLTATVPFTAAEVIPVGEDTSTALAAGVDILADATINTGRLGITLAGGANNPGGAAADNIMWVAGKSFSADDVFEQL